MQSFYGRMYYTQSTNQKGQIQQVQRIQERRRENLYQTRGERPNREKGKQESFQGKGRNITRNHVPFRRWKFQDLKSPINLLTTAMQLVKAMTAEA